MYRVIEYSKSKINEKVINDNHYLVFPGFDGNNESIYLAFTKFLIHKQNKFSEQKQYVLKNDDFNSHLPMINKYERMLDKWKNLQDKMNLSAENILEILEA